MVDPATFSLLSNLLRVQTLVELAKGVGMTLKGLHAESAEGAIGGFDSETDEQDFDRTLRLMAGMEARAGLRRSSP
jgi:hypothetical protein